MLSMGPGISTRCTGNRRQSIEQNTHSRTCTHTNIYEIDSPAEVVFMDRRLLSRDEIEPSDSLGMKKEKVENCTPG